MSEETAMLRQCADEIRQLRNRLAQVEPKAEAYDHIAAILRTLQVHNRTEAVVRAREMGFDAP